MSETKRKSECHKHCGRCKPHKGFPCVASVNIPVMLERRKATEDGRKYDFYCSCARAGSVRNVGCTQQRLLKLDRRSVTKEAAATKCAQCGAPRLKPGQTFAIMNPAKEREPLTLEPDEGTVGAAPVSSGGPMVTVLGTDLASGSDKSMFHCSTCGFSKDGCKHWKAVFPAKAAPSTPVSERESAKTTNPRDFYIDHYQSCDDGEITIEQMFEFASAFASHHSAAQKEEIERLKQELSDERLAFEHSNNVIAAHQQTESELRARITELEAAREISDVKERAAARTLLNEIHLRESAERALQQERERTLDLLNRFDGFVEFYGKREASSPANGEEGIRDMRDKLRLWRTVLDEMRLNKPAQPTDGALTALLNLPEPLQADADKAAALPPMYHDSGGVYEGSRFHRLICAEAAIGRWYLSTRREVLSKMNNSGHEVEKVTK